MPRDAQPFTQRLRGVFQEFESCHIHYQIDGCIAKWKAVCICQNGGDGRGTPLEFRQHRRRSIESDNLSEPAPE
ncbi:MAG TPA: hypothetical protein VEH53_09015, partial [archaeon]|nr:hypothetical protein [archaeon]